MFFFCHEQVRKRHRSGTVVTPYHLRAASEHLGLAECDLRECLREAGGVVWEDGSAEDDQVKQVLNVIYVVIFIYQVYCFAVNVTYGRCGSDR